MESNYSVTCSGRIVLDCKNCGDTLILLGLVMGYVPGESLYNSGLLLNGLLTGRLIVYHLRALLDGRSFDLLYLLTAPPALRPLKNSPTRRRRTSSTTMSNAIRRRLL